MRPHIARVVIDEDRDISDQTDVAVAAIGLQRTPLALKLKLHELVKGNLALQLFPHLLDRPRLAKPQRLRPSYPRAVVLRMLDRAEQREVVQPTSASAT